MYRKILLLWCYCCAIVVLRITFVIAVGKCETCTCLRKSNRVPLLRYNFSNCFLTVLAFLLDWNPFAKCAWHSQQNSVSSEAVARTNDLYATHSLMDASNRRSRKRRRVETPEVATERPAATATTAAKEMSAAPVVSLRTPF